MWQFLNPIFLWAGLATSIPLILHMMQRRRVVPMPFSTVRFLKLAQKRSSNRIRMENFILWLLRTLLLILLTMAFALPIIRTQAFGRFMGSAPRDIAIVWDASYSMSYESSRRNVWQDTRQTVLDLIDGLGHNDRLSLFVAADIVIPLIEQPSGDFEQARALVNAQELEPVEAQLAPALIEAVNSLKESGRREREVYIITDGQELAWRDFQKSASERLEAHAGNGDGAAMETTGDTGSRPGAHGWNPEGFGDNTHLFVALLGAERPENTAPLSLEIKPATLMADTPAQLAVRIGRTGPAQNLAVTLNINGRDINRQSMFIGEDSVETITFALPGLPAGIHEGWVATPPDGLQMDDRLYFKLRVRDRLPVAIAGTPGDVFFIEKALNPVTERATIDATVFRPATLPIDELSNFSTIFLCNALPLSGQAIVALENYVRMGGLLAILPGDRAQPRDYASWNSLPAVPDRIEEIPAGMRRRLLLLLEPTDPLFTGMRLPPGTIPSIVAQRELRFDELHPEAKPVVGSSPELPFLLARSYGAGRVLLFSVSADRRWSNLPLSPFFLPFIHQIVRFGAGLSEDKLFLEPHRTLRISDFLPDIPDGSELLSPRDETIQILSEQREHLSVQIAENIMQPGFYGLRKPGDRDYETAFAVNAPRIESDLTRADAGNIPKWLGVKNLHLAQDRERLSRLITEHREGKPLGELFLWLALLVSMMEIVMANRLSRRGKTLTDQIVIESSGRVKTT